MAVRGTQAKAEIITKLQEIYPNAFLVDKVLRVPMVEDGQTVEIKIALTAAKDVIGGQKAVEEKITDNQSSMTEPTDEEKLKVERAIEKLKMEIW